MIKVANSKTADRAHVKLRSSGHLLVGLTALAAALLSALVAGPGFGLLVLTLSVIASALWMTYGAPRGPSSPAR